MINTTVWLSKISSITNKKLALLPIKDQKAIEKITNQKRKNTFIAGRYLLMQALLKNNITYENHPLVFHELGKPYFKDNIVEFNISHSHDWVCLIISPKNALSGIDCELVEPRNYKQIIENYFSLKEKNYIEQKNSLERFYQLWTLKESMIKQSASSIFSQKKFPSISIDGKKIKLSPKNNLFLENYNYDNLSISICLNKRSKIDFYKFLAKNNTFNPIKVVKRLSTHNDA